MTDKPMLTAPLFGSSSMIVPSKLLMLDEYPHLANAFYERDLLKEEMHAIDGVPKTSYLVGDNKVFVFDRAMELAKASTDLPNLTGEERKQALLSMANSAWMSPHEAVENWQIMPNDYYVREKDGACTIIQRELHAIIPQRFTDTAALIDALALLLVGGIVEGTQKADFTYRGQPFKLLESFDLASLPPRPEFPINCPLELVPVVPDELYFFGMLPIEYVDGFAPLTRDKVAQISSLASNWDRMTWKMKSDVDKHPHLWNLAEQFPLVNLAADFRQPLTAEQARHIGTLRSHYPELLALDDTALYHLYDSYHCEYLHYREYNIAYQRPMETLYRDLSYNFLFHLLGLLSSKDEDVQSRSTLDIGVVVAYGAIQSVDDPLALGMAWYRYNMALCQMTHYARMAMKFVKKDQESRAV